MAGESLLHCFKCIIGIDEPITQTSLNEQKALVKYLKQSNYIAEIGVFEGFNTREFAVHSPSGSTVYAIDPFVKGRLGISYLKLIAVNNWKKNKVIHKIKIVRGPSSDVHSLITQKLDFIFIDGDHAFNAVKTDFELYGKKLSDSGIIAFHDARVFPGGWVTEEWGPVRLINEMIKPNREWTIIEEVDSIVFIQRTSGYN
jgi:predicted O-methyltransferase YrrM